MAVIQATYASVVENKICSENPLHDKKLEYDVDMIIIAWRVYFMPLSNYIN